MTTEIIIALITLAGSAVGTLGGIVINSQMSNYRIEQLEKRLKSITASSSVHMRLNSTTRLWTKKLRSQITELMTSKKSAKGKIKNEKNFHQKLGESYGGQSD